MYIYIFFSVHELLFNSIAKELIKHYGIEKFSGFVWGNDQRYYLENQDIVYKHLNVFTRDILPQIKSPTPDIDYLERCESEYGISLNRMIFAERHLLKGKDFYKVLRLVETTFRLV